MAGKSVPAPPDNYQAEDDHRTLQRAGEVMGDPGRMKKVAAHHAKITRGMSLMLGAAPSEGAAAPQKPAKPKTGLKRKSPRPYVTKRGVARR